MFELARDLGMTVARLLRELGPDEFVQWKALYTVEVEDKNAQREPGGSPNVVSIAEFKQQMSERGRG